jgi:hypothetical protein
MKQNYPIVIILVLSLLIGILTLTHYGESWDDLSLQKYAAKSLDAYLTWPQQGVVKITEEDLGNYGPSYVMAVALGTRLLNAIVPLSLPDLRHLFYFITYLAGVWAFYALSTRWLTRNAALGATLLFMTQPLLWGHAFMNPKDTPFLAFFLLSLSFGFKMADSIKPLPFASLTPSAKKTLALLTALWLVSVFPLFIFTDTFHIVLSSLVQAAHSGETNIISLIASDIHTAAPEIYIQKYFALFIYTRAIYFLAFTSILLYLYRHLLPSSIPLLTSILLPAILLGFTASIRILGPFAGLIVVFYALRTKGRQAIPALLIYAIIASIAMYLTWPYLWTDPVGHLFGSLQTMSAYPWQGRVLFNGVKYASTALPYSYLPVLFGIQLTEPVWALSVVGLVISIIGRRPERVEGEKRKLIELTILWFVIPLLGFIILHSALYDNFRQVLFILPPVFWLAGVVFEKIKNTKWRIALVTLCLLPGILGIVRLHPYEYIYYNSFIGGMDGAQGRFELDYWVISYREAAEYVNGIAPANSAIWVEGPSQLFGLYAREDLKIFSTHEVERADHYDYVIATTRYNLDQTSYPDAKIIYKIMRGDAILTVIKQP